MYNEDFRYQMKANYFSFPKIISNKESSASKVDPIRSITMRKIILKKTQ